MKNKTELLNEKTEFPYYLGYSHYMYGFHRWRERSEKGDETLPQDFLDAGYREGYDKARQDVFYVFDI